MSDELKAAIDRQHRYVKGENGYRVYFPEFVGRNKVWTEAEELEYIARKRRDQSAIVYAYLAEHPADDETPLDESWIKSICDEFGEDGAIVQDYSLNVAICFINTHDPKVWCAELGERQYPWPHDLHTRGQLRRLCAALGIALYQEQSQ